MSKVNAVSAEPIHAVYVTAVEVHAVPIQAEVISSQPYGHDVPHHYESNQINNCGPGPTAYGTPTHGPSNGPPAYGPPAYGPASYRHAATDPGAYQSSSYRPNYTHDNNSNNRPLFQQGLQAPAVQPQFQYGSAIGTCRGCGRQFQRPPNSHESSAGYYRCQNCCEFTTDRFLCVVS